MSTLHIITSGCADSVCLDGHSLNEHSLNEHSLNERGIRCDSVEEIENPDSFSQSVEQSDAEWFLLTETMTDARQIPSPEFLKAIQEKGAAAWFAKSSDSFDDFTVRTLGGTMASLWLPLWKAGSILAPSQAFRSALEKSRSTYELLARLNWDESTGEVSQEIDWENCSIDLPVLAPTKQRTELEQVLRPIRNLEELLPDSYDRLSPDFTALKAGLYQWYDALEESHRCSQQAQHQGRHLGADYWHAIMHRREPDYSNSKYWFRHVGTSPVFDQLLRYAQTISEEFASIETWNPFAFVDYCSRCNPGTRQEIIARRIQAVEMVLLMRQTMLDAQR